jgi:hypothetical protein
MVGRLSYKTLSRQSLPEWVSSTWASMLGYSPELVTLTRGWFSFVFKSHEHIVLVLEKTWVLNGGSLMLKSWRVNFDPTND